MSDFKRQSQVPANDASYAPSARFQALTMRDGIRYRQHVSKRAAGDALYADKTSLKKKEVLPNETQHLLFLFTFFLFVSIVIIAFEKKLPEPLTINKEGLYPGRFIGERAYNHLINLTSIGPRIVGSYANEVLAIKYLTNIINSIVKDASENHKLLVNVTKHSGAFPLKFLDGMTNVYRNVQNVIVKIGPHRPTHTSVLLNCHFDTFADSPGGSDDGAGCAVMLEVLRVIAHSSKLLKHNIIFLFNGAEENLLQASHGFITQHPWAKEVHAFINLEACGAGGRELLFQAGPDSSWMLQVYSKSVPYPYASSLAQEIFESGIVPGDTDFRIFRDFGNVSGLDFAWSTNGYVYHTKFDNIDQIPVGSLQRTGDNILALLQGIVLDNYLSEVIQDNAGKLVFFDFLGTFVIRWPQHVASTINVISIVAGVYSIYLNTQSARRDVKKFIYLKHVLLCIGAITVSWLVSIISCTMIAFVLTKLGKVMSWYARPAWLFFLYVCPTIFVSMMFFLHVGSRQKKEVKSTWILYQIYCDAYSIIWMLILFCCVVFEIRSGFIPLHWVVFPTVGNLLRYNFFNKWRGWKWLLYYLATMFVPYMQSFYLVIGALYLFIPIMGRSGSSINSEVVMANTLCILFCLLLSFTKYEIFYTINCMLNFQHAQRQYYDINGNLRYSGTGYWIADLDMNSPHSVEAMVPEIAAATPTVKDCEHELYCGLPYFMPVTTFLWKTSWIPGPAPLITIPTKLDLISKSMRQNIVSFTFNVTGPDHISIILSPYKGVHLEKWSVLEGTALQGPKWNDRETYFVYYSCASDCVPYTFTVELNVPYVQKAPCLSVALGGHFLHGEHQKSLRFKRFLAQFPPWTVVTPWTATYTSWQF
ncbi:PREDICTED: endoplasmic reticulum metallopeptidase 1-like [Dufourea novaeangliae]|uniref:endoplasmic reticulum metallopeptidase 1-like n=1 Tax=Dufourea novaeangliae TaxID=178035 RepID=UPI000767A169|nr:PREDICTED: endoplasmic reticulum metallopeptidase 1-like [Dufourea novaeangliae]